MVNGGQSGVAWISLDLTSTHRDPPSTFKGYIIEKRRGRIETLNGKAIAIGCERSLTQRQNFTDR